MSDAPTVLDLFCGAGGLSLGFQRAGFRVIAAHDKGAAAVETYRANLGHHAASCERLKAILGRPPKGGEWPLCRLASGRE
ncbi:MAG: DNA cytosine methyltransferase [Candidatus Rokubacteria bacterium]|nr:DNA cytosine methyltransferase [Candidatus Rokubacteria bacterium]